MVRKPLSSLLVLLALLGGCVSMPPRQPVDQEARHALELLNERWREFADFRALADVVVVKGGERFLGFTGVLLVKAPDSIRLEALSPLGSQPVALVVIHEGQLTAYAVAKNEARVGPATAETIANELGLPLEPDDLVAVLAGRAAPTRDLRVAELLPADGAGPSLNLIGVRRERVWLNLQTGEVRRVEIGGGRASVTITYHRDGQAVRGFDFSAGGNYVTGSVTYRNVVVGSGIDADRFTLTLPKGVKIQSIR